MKKQHARKFPLVATGIGPSAAVTTALLPLSALAGSGDLDPGFGDVGRLGSILDGPAWAVEPQDDGMMILGGGRPGYNYEYWGTYTYPPTRFISLLTETGTAAAGFESAAVANIQVLDVVRQPNGQVVAVGRQQNRSDAEVWQLAVYRLQPDGALDTTFARAGVFELSVVEHGSRHLATSVVLDPDGRIVVAGSRDNALIVLRLLPDGSIDDSFGVSGMFVGPDNLDSRTSILRTADGGYRLTASNAEGCQLVALTASGVIDDGYGNDGIATVGPPAGAASTYCNAVSAQADGRLVVVGQAAGQGFAARVLANGQPDPGFSAASVAGAMSDATAVAVGADGRIAVAGIGESGAAVMRLQASGELDALFGNGGFTHIDLYYDGAYVPTRDMKILADGSVVAAGGDYYGFVVRLLPDNGGDSPGVLGIVEQGIVSGAEGDDIVFHLRRTGGSAGEVSVTYEVSDGSAESGVDFDVDLGRLTWTDGDVSIREIRLPALQDDEVEDEEYFEVSLSDPQGGAGLGTTITMAKIAADGSPHGQFNLTAGGTTVAEGGSAEIWVHRNWYFEGAVSVTLTPTPSSATAGEDFAGDPVTVSWVDGDSQSKLVSIPIINDADDEDAEQFKVELSNPAGGAILARPTRTGITIMASDSAPSDTTSSGGGGALGFLSLLLLGAASLCRGVLGLERRE
jgi:uncharacterized delta-60 repeat protein